MQYFFEANYSGTDTPNYISSYYPADGAAGPLRPALGPVTVGSLVIGSGLIM